MLDKNLQADLADIMQLVSEDIYQSDDYCLICGYEDFEEGNELIYCSFCEISVHISCYGLEENAKDKDFKCNNCKAFGSNSMSIQCSLCFKVGGAMKPS